MKKQKNALKSSVFLVSRNNSNLRSLFQIFCQCNNNSNNRTCQIIHLSFKRNFGLHPKNQWSQNLYVLQGKEGNRFPSFDSVREWIAEKLENFSETLQKESAWATRELEVTPAIPVIDKD